MTCRELVDFVTDYLEGGLSDEQRTAFDGHLEECPPCIEYLNSYRETVQLGRAVYDDPDAEVPADVPERIVQAILAARGPARG